MSILFPGTSDVLATVERLRRLADDLERMTVFSPNEKQLDGAPTLSEWSLERRTVLALVGNTHGHPEIGDCRAVTSEVFAIDGGGAWARTLSRFYNLAPPALRRGRGR